MNFEETIRSAINALIANKIRSFLTMLGVVIGVFAVVTLISLGRGIQNYIEDEFNALGTNLLFVAPGNAGIADDPALAFTGNRLDEKHLDLIDTQAGEYLVTVFPYITVAETATHKTVEFFSEIVGVTPAAVKEMNYNLSSGREFTLAEQNTNSKVAVLGPQVADEMFPGNNALGKKIELGDENYEVIGVFKSKGSNYDDQILVPYTSAMETFNIDELASIVAKVKEDVDIEIAIRQIEVALLRDLNEDEFTILSQQELLDSIQSTLRILTIGLGAIAAISLLVGGIGIMNIMLVSVNERIREIGLRKAVGATPQNIAAQFMSESIVLSVLGGVIGLLLGFGASLIAQRFIRAEVPFSAVLLAFGFSVLVGVVFGTYPAYQASQKDPIDALRYE